MPVEYFIRYQGKCYDVGTRLKFKAVAWGYYEGIKEGVIEKFIGSTAYIRADDGQLYTFSTMTNCVNFDKVIKEIIDPVYYTAKQEAVDRNYPLSWQVENGLIWYIIIMTAGLFFEARLLIWIVATIFFFAWATGRLNKK